MEITPWLDKRPEDWKGKETVLCVADVVGLSLPPFFFLWFDRESWRNGVIESSRSFHLKAPSFSDDPPSPRNTAPANAELPPSITNVLDQPRKLLHVQRVALMESDTRCSEEQDRQ